MPFIRYARDKRGYESTFVMHAPRPGQGPLRARVLYLFRTPAHVKIGRRPLEPEVREALEHTHPDLSFDWSTIPAERPSEPPDRERDYRRDGSGGRPGGRGGQRPGRPAPGPEVRPAGPPAQPAVIEDESPLGRVVGPERAARLRTRYAELTERVVRRARTAEDRDRLLERLQRLNPDEWGDETAIRALVFTVETEWNALAAELPSRRRGRRGGRHRHEGAEAGRSGIIEDEAPPETDPGLTDQAGEPFDPQDGPHDAAEFSMDGDDRDPSGGRRGSGGSESADLRPADAASADAGSPGGDSAEPAEPEPGVPGDH